MNAAIVTWLFFRAMRWMFWIVFLTYSFYVTTFHDSQVNTFGHLSFTTELIIFGLGNAAVFAGFLELMMRERAGIPRPTFGRLIPTSGSSN
jgi:hypothetical protein